MKKRGRRSTKKGIESSVCNLYENGYGMKDLASKFFVSKSTIRNILVHNKVTIRPIGKYIDWQKNIIQSTIEVITLYPELTSIYKEHFESHGLSGEWSMLMTIMSNTGDYKAGQYVNFFHFLRESITQGYPEIAKIYEKYFPHVNQEINIQQQ